MNTRPHGRKHTVALWMLVALADVMLVVTSSGLPAVLLIALLVAGVVLVARLAKRRIEHRPVTQGVRSWQLARAQTEGRGWLESRV